MNPTQFNEASDLAKYPRTLEADLALLEAVNCTVLFIIIDSIYPADYIAPNFDFGDIVSVMEGKYRPGHFDGVAEVVYRLLKIVEPNAIYMGQKDFQQVCSKCIN